jgi:hypothetical protein
VLAAEPYVVVALYRAHAMAITRVAHTNFAQGIRARR